jgi:hypothetical protein
MLTFGAISPISSQMEETCRLPVNPGTRVLCQWASVRAFFRLLSCLPVPEPARPVPLRYLASEHFANYTSVLKELAMLLCLQRTPMNRRSGCFSCLVSIGYTPIARYNIASSLYDCPMRDAGTLQFVLTSQQGQWRQCIYSYKQRSCCNSRYFIF